MYAGVAFLKRGVLSHVGRTSPGTRTPYRRYPIQLYGRFNFQRSTMSTSSLPPFNPEPAHRWTQYPDGTWKLGDGLKTTTDLGRKWKEDENAGWKTMDLDTMDKPCVPCHGQRRLHMTLTILLATCTNCSSRLSYRDPSRLCHL